MRAARRAREPGAERPGRDGEGLAETLLGEARCIAEPEPCADDERADGGAAERDLLEDGAGDLEQSAGERELGLERTGRAVEGRPPPSDERGQELLEGVERSGDQAAEPFGADALVRGGVLDVDRRPGRVEAHDDAERDERDRGAWLRGRFMGCRHGVWCGRAGVTTVPLPHRTPLVYFRALTPRWSRAGPWRRRSGAPPRRPRRRAAAPRAARERATRSAPRRDRPDASGERGLPGGDG